MKVLHVATAHRRGGAERNLIHTMQWELDRGWQVHAAVGPLEYRPSFPPKVNVHLITHMFRAVSPYADLASAWNLYRLIHTENFDIVHTHQSKAGILGRAAAWRQAPVIVHTVHMPSFGPSYAPLASRLFRALEILFARATDRFITVGAELRDIYLRAGVGRPEQYVVIRSPVDISRFAALRAAPPDQRRRWREEIDVPGGARLILMIGALDRRKRHDLALRHLAPVLKERNLFLTIAGEGPLEADLRSLAGKLGVANRVRLLGFVEDVAPLLGVADALVHLSEVEGVPQVVVQAHAAGVPVVATSVPGLGEIEGAPLLAVEEDCADLLDAVKMALEHRETFTMPDVDTLAPWAPANVNGGLQAVHAEIEALVESRTVNTE